MVDINEYNGNKGDLQYIYVELDVLYAVSLLSPETEMDPTYLWEEKRIDYIMMTPVLTEVSLKVGHH